MNKPRPHAISLVLGVATIAATTAPMEIAFAAPPGLTWATVVNNNDTMPPLSQRKFNSYNQPSVNAFGLVVLRARSRGGSGRPTHGIYARDMSAENPLDVILDNTTEVPQPNNLNTTFIETPAFPRIDMWSDTIVTRGNHQPVWSFLEPDNTETRAGTTGIYTTPFGDLITGVAKLGNVPDFEFFAVPGLDTSIPFDVFPGAPAVTDGDTIVFKGNFTVDLVGKTGVFYRTLTNDPIVLSDGTELAPAGGDSEVQLIANSVNTLIPGSTQVFGSTAPPSAAGDEVVFAGFDNEENPTLGGIYVAPIASSPPLTALVSIGDRVPEQPPKDTFRSIGEALSFDGDVVGFWGAWGTQTRTVRLYCPQEGNKDRIAYCNRVLTCGDTGEILGDPNSICDDTSDPMFPTCYQEKQVPVEQGIFVYDRLSGQTRAIAKTGARFDDFLFWNYSGKPPCTGSGGSDEGDADDGEPARWRSSAFVSVSGPSTVFKAVARDDVGIFLSRWPARAITTLVDTSTDGQILDSEAPLGSTITEVGLEREGFRNGWLAISAVMGVEGGTEEEGMAGIYVARLPH